MTNGNNEIIIANRNGRAIRFHEAAVRVMGRIATGVRGITPVSYTHLDVYKRQAHSSLNICHFFHTTHIFALSNHHPVSYTHLDFNFIAEKKI